MFYNGLRLDFKRELIIHIMNSLKETFLLALKLEFSLKALLNRKSIFKIKTFYMCEGYGHHSYECTSIKCSMCKRYGHHAYECPSIKCSKYGEFGHYDYQCPSKSQHTDNVQIDDIDNSRIAEDVQFPSDVTSDVDELEKSSTPIFDDSYS